MSDYILAMNEDDNIWTADPPPATDTTFADLFGGFPLVMDEYSRAQAIEDGELVEVDSDITREAGIKYPVALTRAVWDHCVELTPMAERMGNNIEGRLWDVIWMFREKARRTPLSELTFQLYVVLEEEEPTLVTLKAICGPGDDPEPVITIAMPNED